MVKFMDNKDKTVLPYNIDIKLVGKLLQELKTVGKEGISKDTLLKNVGESTNRIASYSLTLLRYVQIIDSDGEKVWLTKFGSIVCYAPSIGSRNLELIRNLPDKYKTMAKWIYHNNGAITTGEVKLRFAKEYGPILKQSTLENGINAFFNYAQFIGLVAYGGRGKSAKATLTEKGKDALLMVDDVNKQSEAQDTELKMNPDVHESYVRQPEVLPTGDIYPIRIITRDRDFAWDIKGKDDLSVIDAVINAIISNWEKKGKGGNPKDDKEHD